MIFFFEHGRLGNQLFQYVGLKKYFSDQALVLFGCDDLSRTFIKIEAAVLENSRIPRWISLGLLRPIFFVMSAMRIIGTISEALAEEGYSIVLKKGLIPNVYLLKNTYFQHRKVIENLPSVPQIHPDLVSRAKDWLASKGFLELNHALVFVHIRRGDYLYWPTREYPAILGLDWYRRAMAQVERRVEKPLFIVMGDDYFYSRDVFNESESLVISKNEPGVDLAIMSLCDHGIMSASTFAWWGGWISRESRSPASKNLYFAPNYWGGHRKKVWHPAGFKSDWVTYLE